MSTNNIDKMAQQFKSLAELQLYCDAQYQTIISLTKKVNELEHQKVHLEEVLSNSTPNDKENSAEIQLITLGTDEETICRIQLRKLKDKSIKGDELTLEETKRVEIYTKLLLAIKNGEKVEKEDGSKTLDDAALLTLLGDLK